MAKLHRAKERQPPSLPYQTSVYTLSPEGGVVWNLPYYNISTGLVVDLLVLVSVKFAGPPFRDFVGTGRRVLIVGRHDLIDSLRRGQGGLARLPVNRFVNISLCTPRRGSNLTPKVYLLMTAIISFRLGKLACPRVNDDQKIHVDDHKLSSGRPHDYWILERLFYEILCFYL